MEEYFSSINRKKSLEKGRLVFVPKGSAKSSVYFGILLLAALSIYAGYLLYISFKGEFYIPVLFFIFFPILSFAGLFVPNKLRKVQLIDSDRALIKEYFSNDQFRQVVKTSAMLVICPNYKVWNIPSPTLITIIYDRKDTYINCSTFYPLRGSILRTKSVLFYFLDKKHEKKLERDLNAYIRNSQLKTQH